MEQNQQNLEVSVDRIIPELGCLLRCLLSSPWPLGRSPKSFCLFDPYSLFKPF